MARRFKRTSKKKTEDTVKMGKIKHKKTEVDGIIFDSEMESKYYTYLKELKANGIVESFNRQPKYILQEKFIVVDGEVIFGTHRDFKKIKGRTKAPTVQAIKYKSDFEVFYTDGHVEIVDPKGVATADFELKRKMFLCKYPTKDLKVVQLYKGEWVDYYVNKKRIAAEKKAKKLQEVEGGK
jgi:hypothetical protein